MTDGHKPRGTASLRPGEVSAPLEAPDGDGYRDRLFWTPPWAAWAVVEVDDPVRSIAGRVSEVELFRQTMVRIEQPGDGPERIRIFSAGLVREVVPCTEAKARAVAALQPRSTSPDEVIQGEGGGDGSP